MSDNIILVTDTSATQFDVEIYTQFKSNSQIEKRVKHSTTHDYMKIK